ncbi:hypothetical protein [Ornithinimicrobium cerasi]|uniref:hypothetical protein n=1 Tax=Ornithinimicrobium cerasi TaxID=2248773 RepID=UPI000F002820|nr:hypothetical protein [Ornithinimicrobium cerasi]
MSWSTAPPGRGSVRVVLVVAVLVLTLVAVALSTAFLLRPSLTPAQWALARDVPTLDPQDPVADPQGLHLLLVPHPDDELSGWGSLLDRPDLRPVLVLLTRGEATQRCGEQAMANHLQVELGEVAPRPDPTSQGASSTACEEARLQAFRTALGEAARHTPVLAVDWSLARPATVAGQGAEVVEGRHATVVLLDLGDDALTASGVTEVLAGMLDAPPEGVPDLPVGRITAAAYYATRGEVADRPTCEVVVVCPAGERAYVYDRPDHLAVREAARALAERAAEGSWLATSPFDPAASVHRALPQELYDLAMGLGPGDAGSAPRMGTYQRVYGWLAFPDVWRRGDLPLARDQVMFPRVQSYEVVPP